MKHFYWTLSLLIALSFSCRQTAHQTENSVSQKTDVPFAIVIHGGAGYITPENISPEIAAMYRDTLQLALETGYAILERGGSSLDAIEAAIRVLEDCSMFNAGKGSVYNSAAEQEMDASIMDGESLNSGAVAGVMTIKNPISAARLVMDSSSHVMLAGRGAEKLAQDFGLEIVDKAYFYEKAGFEQIMAKIKEEKHGTVGAVAIDKKGNIAAATSTGGMFNKKWNRIGDSPIIGAGTYANNASCGISCTGTGEFFIRTVAAHEVSSLMLYSGVSLNEAMHNVLFDQIGPLGGVGGMIGIDKSGNISWDFNTPGMFRGYISSSGDTAIELFGKQEES